MCMCSKKEICYEQYNLQQIVMNRKEIIFISKYNFTKADTVYSKNWELLQLYTENVELQNKKRE